MSELGIIFFCLFFCPLPNVLSHEKNHLFCFSVLLRYLMNLWPWITTRKSLCKFNERITHILRFCKHKCFLFVSVNWGDKCPDDDCCEHVSFSYLVTVVTGRIGMFQVLQPVLLLKSMFTCSIHVYAYERMNMEIVSMNYANEFNINIKTNKHKHPL